jgi:hypothetical protein
MSTAAMPELEFLGRRRRDANTLPTASRSA